MNIPIKESTDDVVKEWIAFLKRNQIVDLKSDEKTGSLRYRKKVTPDIVLRFLDSVGVDETTAKKAVNSVIEKKKSLSKSRDVSTWMHTEISPAERPSSKNPKHDKNNKEIEDIKYKELTEKITDEVIEFDEEDVEYIFDLVKSSFNNSDDSTDNTADNSEEDKVKALNTIKSFIRNNLSSSQRRALWRSLNEA